MSPSIKTLGEVYIWLYNFFFFFHFFVCLFMCYLHFLCCSEKNYIKLNSWWYIIWGAPVHCISLKGNPHMIYIISTQIKWSPMARYKTICCIRIFSSFLFWPISNTRVAWLLSRFGSLHDLKHFPWEMVIKPQHVCRPLWSRRISQS